MQEQITRSGGTVVQSIVTQRNAAGLPEVVTDELGQHVFQHDAAGQITSVDHPAGSGLVDESYTYDAAGNRKSWTGSPATSVSYDAANRLLSDGRYTYRYDDEGRLLSRTARSDGATTRFEWNALGELVRVAPSSGAAITYGPDERPLRHGGAGGASTRGYLCLL